MVPEQTRLVYRTTFGLLLLAALAVEVAAHDGREVWHSLALAGAWIAVAAIVARLLPVPADPRRLPPSWVLGLLVVLALAPFVTEPLRREWTGDGYPLELQMVCALRNIGLGLAACAGWLFCLRLACVVSLFLMLFAAAMTNHPAVLVILGLYTACGSVWLLLVYWSGLQAVLVHSNRMVSLEVLPERQRLPWLGLSLLGLCLVAALALVIVGPKRTALALGEWLPTSGGTGQTDLFARYGIGDGPEETAGEDARAAGMVETDRMIEDNNNSLIDAISDMYGPPKKPPQDRERMVAAGRAEMIEFHGKLPDNRRPSRDFDTSRKGPKNPRKARSRSARAVFEVQGRTPLHIRTVAYETYDPSDHRWREARKPVNRFLEAQKGYWMKRSNFLDVDWYLCDEKHRLKVADLKSNLVPTPSLLTRFRINKVDSPDYYEWDYEGVLVLSGRKRTPPGVVVSTECRTLEPRRLPATAFGMAMTAGGIATPLLREVPGSLHSAIAALAQEWAGSYPQGWPQIQAILDRLRNDYTLDEQAVAPDDHPIPVLWFLQESQRGPDYLFSTAAALLLRSLGYPARVCLGYYADPQAYDPETAHTPVRVTDLHFWPEVLLRDGHWLVIEPTPGYEVLGPNLPLAELIQNALMGLAGWAWRNAILLIVSLGVLLGMGWYRQELFDALAVQWWRWFPGPTWRDQVRRAAVVLERRARWAGKARPGSQTLPTWLTTGSLQRKPDESLGQFSRMAEWAAYAPNLSPPWSEREVLPICRRVLADWKIHRWRAMPSKPSLGV